MSLGCLTGETTPSRCWSKAASSNLLDGEEAALFCGKMLVGP